jgi:acetyl esterase
MLSIGGPADSPRPSLEDRRHSLLDLMRFADKGVEVGYVEDRHLPGPDGAIDVRLYTPLAASAGRLPGLVYFHGGGLVAGSLDSHDALCRVLANETGCRIVSVGYRLAPEHKFPTAVMDAAAATRWVLTHDAEFGLDPTRIGVGGDSAGAALAITACHMMREAQGPLPAFQLLLCPITDYAADGGSREEFANGFLVDKAMIDGDLEHYLGGGVQRTDPRVSPLRIAAFSGLPRAFIHTAEFDPFRDEGHAYASALLDAGVDAAYTCHAGMIHLFYAMPGVIPYGRSAMKLIGAEIRAALQVEG